MKKIENKKNIVKNKFTKFFRASLLSLFVMLTIPSISSGIFGNGDAEAGCKPLGSSGTFLLTQAQINNAAFCGGTSTATSGGGCLTRPTFSVTGNAICQTSAANATSSCKLATAAADKTVKCVSLDKLQCAVITASCVWAKEDVNNNKLVDAVCRVYQIASGNAGKAFAAVGVISVGIGFFTGKVSWGLMISVAAGIATFFGAPSIISVISGDDATNLCADVK